MSPGMYHTLKARRARELARNLMDADDRLGPHFIPAGKNSMLEGGIGAVRLSRLSNASETYFILGATLSGIVDDGVPVLVDQSQYDRVIDDLKSRGSVRVTLSGRVQLLDSATFVRRVSSLPTWAVRVDKIRMARTQSEEALYSSAFITFCSQLESEREEYWKTSFATFPLAKGGQLQVVADWLQRYVDRYGGEHSRILADYDAYSSSFQNTDLPLPERLAGSVSSEVLKELSRTTHTDVVVYGDYVEGDSFSGIQESTILNRSAFVVKPYEESPLRVDDIEAEIEDDRDTPHRF